MTPGLEAAPPPKARPPLVRIGALAGGSVAFLAAAFVAFTGGEGAGGDPPQPTERIENHRAPLAVMPRPPRIAEVSFIVRFRQGHPLARAQTLSLQGRRDDASAAAERALKTRRELRGLCFQRFTLGGEIVLALCEQPAVKEAERVSLRWEQRLRRTSGVERADRNVILQPEGQ